MKTKYSFRGDDKIVTEEMGFSSHLTSAALVGRYPTVKFAKVTEAGAARNLWKCTGRKSDLEKVRKQFAY